jgi:hypothetical protein
LSIAESISLVTLLDLLGEAPEERCKVWLHNADDDRNEIIRRVAAFCRLHKITMTDLEGWLFITGKDDFDFRVARGIGQQLVPDNNTIADITDTIQSNGIDVFIPDPLVAFHSVGENTPGAMSDVDPPLCRHRHGLSLRHRSLPPHPQAEQ